MSTPTLTRPDADLRHLLHPSREQLRMAAAMFRVATEDVTSVVVPVVVVLDEGNRLEHPGGYWLADRGAPGGAYDYRAAREAAEAAAQAHVLRRGGTGVPGWVTIRPGGSWVALEGA